MNKSDMTCSSCICGYAIDGKIECRCLPSTIMKDPTDWCAHGRWGHYMQRFDEFAIYCWGEWSTDEWKDSQVHIRIAS